MAFERAFIDLNLAVDLDSVAGNFDKAEDFVTFIEQTIKNAIPHYKPEVTTKNITLKPYVWNEDKTEYIQPKLEEDVRLPKVGDNVFSLEDGEDTIGLIMDNEGNDNAFVVMESGLTIDTCDLKWNESENRWEYGDLERK